MTHIWRIRYLQLVDLTHKAALPTAYQKQRSKGVRPLATRTVSTRRVDIFACYCSGRDKL